MTIYCLGSINADHFYAVPHIPSPGETLAATDLATGLGGKGANQSVAAAKAGVRVVHIGAVGPGSGWILDRLRAFGVETDHIAELDVPTGHAIINVAADGENAIVILPGANACQSGDRIRTALADAQAGDLFLLQNETTLQAEAAEMASGKGLRVLYSAAPFDPAAVKAVLPYIDTLLLNEIEARQLEKTLDQSLFSLPVGQVVITLGSKGARWIDVRSGDVTEVEAERVIAVDTTGAGDTFAGYLAAALHEGQSAKSAMTLAARAAALKVTRKGTADAVPTRAEVEAFRP